jgi:hypothetical protein
MSSRNESQADSKAMELQDPVVSGTSGVAKGTEKRTAPRAGYEYVQKVAPVRKGAVPKPHDFFDVECCDLSRGGMAFYLPAAPDFNELLVVLGRKHELMFLRAEVCNVQEMASNGSFRYRVGCRFTGRLNA